MTELIMMAFTLGTCRGQGNLLILEVLEFNAAEERTNVQSPRLPVPIKRAGRKL